MTNELAPFDFEIDRWNVAILKSLTMVVEAMIEPHYSRSSQKITNVGYVRLYD